MKGDVSKGKRRMHVKKVRVYGVEKELWPLWFTASTFHCNYYR